MAVQNKYVIVFSGFNQRGVIALLRTLEAHQINYAIIAISSDDPILSTIYKKRVLLVRKSVPLDLYDIIYSINIVVSKNLSKKYILAPSTEALNRFLLANRDAIESDNIVIPLISKNTYEIISDKHRFGELCTACGIRVPYEYSCINDAPVPFVAKPKRYFSEGDSIYNPHLIFSLDEKESFIKKFKLSDFFSRNISMDRVFIYCIILTVIIIFINFLSKTLFSNQAGNQ